MNTLKIISEKIDKLLNRTLDKKIHKLLTRDDVSRKRRYWKLLSEQELEKVWTETEELRKTCTYNTQYLTLPNLNKNFEPYTTLSWSSNIIGNEQYQSFFSRIDKHFPLIVDFLKHFKGKIVACGGSIFKTLHREETNTCDIDLFFTDPNVSNSNPNKTNLDYTYLLTEALQYLTQKFLKMEAFELIYIGDGTYPVMDKILLKNNRVHIVRNEYVTTLYLCAESFEFDCYNPHTFKYQFIHRIYPDVGSILGGFDLGPCMIAFDGDKILATELGAWSAFSKIIIVDTKRRSTSFEHRLIKYNHICTIILPGIKDDTFSIRDTLNSTSRADMYNIIEQFIKNNGYDFLSNVKGLLTFEEYEQIETISHKIVERKLLSLIEKSGYDVNDKNTLLLDFWKHIKEKPVKVYNWKELHTKLIELCKSHDYIWEPSYKPYQDYANSREPTWDSDDEDIKIPHKYYDRHYEDREKKQNDTRQMKKKQGILKPKYLLRLPKVIINCNDKEERRARWNITTTRDDYQDFDYRVNKISDYEDNQVFPDFTPYKNATALRCNKLQSVASFMTIVRENYIPLLGNEDKYILHIVSTLKYKTVDFLNTNTKILSVIEKSINEPDLGDLTLDLRFRIQYLIMRWFFTSGKNGIADTVTFREPEHLQEMFMRYLTKMFAEYADEVYDILKLCPTHLIDSDDRCSYILDKLQYYIDIMEARLIQNSEICKQNLIGIKWITENPGRQWTSSINPIIENPREWYGKRYTPFVTGYPKEEQTLRLIRKRSKLWNILNKDIFNIILMKFTFGN